MYDPPTTLQSTLTQAQIREVVEVIDQQADRRLLF